MNLKEKLDNSTHKAWESLYQRLESDGLISVAVNPKQPEPRTRTITYAWAASIAAVLIALTTWLVMLKSNPAEETLTVSNRHGMPTLVTTLQDGSTIYLAEETSIEYPAQFTPGKREVSLTGDAFFEVAPNASAPFIIDTHSALVEVVGTAFSLQSKEETFELAVTSGQVRVTSKATNTTVQVGAGETALIHNNKLQTMPTNSVAPFRHYLNNLHFKDQTIANVIRIMNLRNSDNTQIAVAPEIAERKFTVTFANQSPEEIAHIICVALNLKQTRTQNTININPSD